MEKDIFINMPVQDVFAFAIDPATAKKWQDGIILAEQTSDGPFAVGATTRQVQKIMGREMNNTSEVTAYDPPNKFCFKSTSGPVEFEGCVTCVEQDGGTLITLDMQGEAGGFFKVAEPLLRRQLNKGFESNLRNLKEVLEG